MKQLRIVDLVYSIILFTLASLLNQLDKVKENVSPHLFLKLLRVEWKASHLDKSLKQKSTVPRIFLKISETNFYSRKKIQ